MIVSIAASLLLVPTQRADAEEATLFGLPEEARPIEVKLGLYLADVTDVNERQETFDIQGQLTLRWHDPRLASEAADDLTPAQRERMPERLYQGDFAVKEIFEGWRPHVVFANGVGDRSVSQMMLAVWPDGSAAYAEAFHATIESPMALRRFPFDRQDLEITIRPFVWGEEDVVLVADHWTTAAWLSAAGNAQWRFDDLSLRERTHETIYLDGSRAAVSELVARIGLARRPWHYLIAVIAPLTLLVLLSWSVFWMEEEGSADRINVSFIGILSVVAYNFVVLERVPEIPYLSLMDVFILTSLVLLAASVGVSLRVARLRRKGNTKGGRRLDRTCRWLFPAAYALSVPLLGALLLAFD